jgi:hypothetical protein
VETLRQYTFNEAGQQLMARQAGTIARQRLQELPEGESDFSNFGEFE